MNEQSGILEELLHSDTRYTAGSKVLEAGCGVGGQTVILTRRSPEAEFVSIDISQKSLSEARARVDQEGISNVKFQQSDITNLPFGDEEFDHVFVCFVLEHLSSSLDALAELKRVLKSGGTITAIEGDHGSCFWYPETPDSLKVWDCMIKAQQYLGHDPLIGRRVYPLLEKAGFHVREVSPKWVYTDSSKPELMDGVVNKIIVPMTQTAREQSFELGLVDHDTWQRGIEEMENVAIDSEGTFFYTWFKGIAVK